MSRDMKSTTGKTPRGILGNLIMDCSYSSGCAQTFFDVTVTALGGIPRRTHKSPQPIAVAILNFGEIMSHYSYRSEPFLF